MKMRTIMEEVEEILVKDPRARNSDEFLYGMYLNSKGVGLVSVVTFNINFAKYNVASFGTVSRARRKIQELRPELQASKEVQEMRNELQGSFFDFARGFDADV